MSDKTPSSSSDVEDVLTSIRKLVSDEARSRSTSEAEAPLVLDRPTSQESSDKGDAPSVKEVASERAAHSEPIEQAAPEQELTRDQDAHSEAVPSFLRDAPLILTSSQRVAETVSASAREAQAEANAAPPRSEAAGQEPPQDNRTDGDTTKKDVTDNSSALPSFLSVSGEASQDTLIDDIAEEDLMADELMIPAAAAIDEEKLREMVREMVQDELRGALGDRITRNIRKLIRRELAAMLNAKGS